MSGGSFDYLCWARDLEDLISKKYALEEMTTHLSELDEKEYPGAAAAAEMTSRLLKQIQLWDAHARSSAGLLEEVWKAVEWNTSGDWGKDSVKDALKKMLEPN